MEYVEGVGLILLGLLVIVLGSAAPQRLPAWLDHVFKWGIGILCIWFGISLLLGHSHFF